MDDTDLSGAAEVARELAAGGYPKGIARKEEIIAVATVYFGRTGFHKATMLQLAAACGISRAGLLHHFGSKEEVLAAVLETRDRIDGYRFQSISEVSPPGLGQLRGFVAGASYNTTVPEIVGLYAILSAEATVPGHPAHEYFQQRYTRLRASVRLALSDARDNGLLREGVDIDALAAELPALMDGLQVQWLLEPERIDMPGIIRARLQRVLTVPL